MMITCSQALPADRCVTLSEIAAVRVGLAFRARLDRDPAGTLCVVQARDIMEDGTIDLAGAVTIAEARVKPDHRLRAGDIVVQPKGTAIRAGLVPEPVQVTVAAAPLQIIRPKGDQVRPAFLVVALNMPRTIAALLQQSRGSHIPQVPTDAFRALRLPLPDLDRQAAIAALAESVRTEKRIFDEIVALRSRLLEAVICESARNTQGRANAPG
jgi:hypothetical protein